MTEKVVGVVLVLLGLFYALAPHSVHVSSGLGLGLDHIIHVVLGLVLLVVGAYVGWFMKPLEKHLAAKPARKAKRRRR